jgi:hypothetical protein
VQPPALAVALDAVDHGLEAQIESPGKVLAQAAHAGHAHVAVDSGLVLDGGRGEGDDARVPALHHALGAPAPRVVEELRVLRREVLRAVVEAAVVGLARRQAPAGDVALVVDDDGATAPAQGLRTRQPGDPRADDSDARGAQVLADSGSGSGQSRMYAFSMRFS